MISDYLADLALMRRAPATIEAYRRDLKLILGGEPPDRLTANDIRERLAKHSRSARTDARRLAALRSFYKWALATGRVTHSPTDHIGGIRIGDHLPVYLTDTELVTFMATVAKHGSRRDYALFACLFGTGIRVSEALGLSLSARTSSSLAILGKGDKMRFVPVSVALRAAFLAYTPGRKELKFGKLFALTRARVAQLMQKYGGLADIEKRLSPHVARHTFAFLAYQKNKDLRALQETLGHSSPVTTQIYAHLAGEATTATVNAVDWRDYGPKAHTSRS